MSRHETPILLLVYLALGVQRWKLPTVVYKGSYLLQAHVAMAHRPKSKRSFLLGGRDQRHLQLDRSVFGRILLGTRTYMYLKVHVRKGHVSLQTNRTATEPVHHHRFSTLVSYMILGMVAVMNAGLYPVQTIVH